MDWESITYDLYDTPLGMHTVYGGYRAGGAVYLRGYTRLHGRRGGTRRARSGAAGGAARGESRGAARESGANPIPGRIHRPHQRHGVCNV